MSQAAIRRNSSQNGKTRKVAEIIPKLPILRPVGARLILPGPVAIVIFRGVPVLAEASILWMGIHGLSWKRFLPPLLLANLGIAFAYSAFGEFAAEHQWLPLALGVSVALPVLLMLLLSRLSIKENEKQIGLDPPPADPQVAHPPRDEN